MTIYRPVERMEERPILVTAAVIVSEGKVLMDRRRGDSRFEPLKWEFPGGKVDFGESPQASLKRELKEELGVVAEVGELLNLASHVYSTENGVRHVVILFFECLILEGDPQPLEGGEVGWFDGPSFSDLRLVEADLPMIGPVLSRLMRGRA